MDNFRTGQLIKKLLEKRNMSQDDLAEYLNISKSAVSKNLNGKSGFDLSNLIEISNYFDISLDNLIKGDSVETENSSDYKRAVEVGLNYIKKKKKEGMNISDFDIDNKSMLYYAIKENDVEIFKFLMTNNYHPNSLTKTFKNTVSIYSDSKVVRFILSHQLLEFVEREEFSRSTSIIDRRRANLKRVVKLNPNLEDEEMIDVLSDIRNAEFLRILLLKRISKIGMDHKSGKSYEEIEYRGISNKRLKTWTLIIDYALKKENLVLLELFLDNYEFKTHGKELDEFLAILVKYNAYKYIDILLNKHKTHRIDMQVILSKCDKEQVKEFIKRYK